MNVTTRTVRHLLLAASVVCLCGAISPVAAAPSKDHPQDPAAAVKEKPDVIGQVSIMAKVMETRLKLKLGRALVKDGIFESGGVRGFRVPGIGIVFLANVDFPLVQEKAQAAEPPSPKEDVLWDLVERGARGFESGPWGFLHVTKDDSVKVAALNQTIRESLQKYSHRLTAVDPNENVVVVIGGIGKRDISGLVYDSADDYEGTGADEYRRVLQLFQTQQAVPDYGLLTLAYRDRESAALLPWSAPATWWVLRNEGTDFTDPSAPSESRLTDTTSKRDAKIAKETTIMSRILESSLGGKLGDDIVKASMVQRGVQGFYVPGAGALFFVEAKFPLAGTPQEGTRRKASRDDLWERHERELEGRTWGTVPASETDAQSVLVAFDSALRPEGINEIAAQVVSSPTIANVDIGETTTTTQLLNIVLAEAAFGETGQNLPLSSFFLDQQEQVNRDKAEKLKATIFEVLARYGRRLEAPGDDERIAVVVNRRRGPTNQSQLAAELLWDVLYNVHSSEPLNTLEGNRAPAAADAQWLVRLPLSSGQIRDVRDISLALDHGSVLSIVVAKKDLVDDPKKLAERASVEIYTY